MYHVQNRDRNVVPKNYKHLNSDQLLVTSIFYTIQGEGPYAGKPAWFIRLAGCNRGDKKTGCEFCDTYFAYDEGKVRTVDELVEAVADPKPRSLFRPLVVITGGEPMIQDNVSNLVGALAKVGHTVQIESNGDRLALGFPDDTKATLVVSPKVVPSKGEYRKLRDEVASRLDYLKFVVDARENSPYHKLPEWVIGWNPDRIFVSPLTIYRMGVVSNGTPSMWDPDLINHAKTAANHKYAAAMAMERGYRVSVQTHLLLQVA